MTGLCRTVCNIFTKSRCRIQSEISYPPVYTQIRTKFLQPPWFGKKNYWPKWKMMRDHRRRLTFKEYGVYKTRINGIRKAEILPEEIRNIADQEVAAIPRDAAMCRLDPLCIITAKRWALVHRYKLGRMMFRHLADYNKLAGVQRARWS